MNELQVVERNPKNEVVFGQKAADALMHIVREKKLARKFGGEKEHLFVEAWEILGQFAGFSAVVKDAEPVEVDGVKGARASVSLVDSDQHEIGGAIAYCMRDEPNWKNKPWFQLASMAQTRAVSKAYRIKLGWVAVMAGYSGTPAEEMEGVYPKPTPTPIPQKKIKPKEAPPEESRTSREEYCAEIRQLMTETGTNEVSVLNHYKIATLEDASQESLDKLMGILLDRKASMDESTP